MARGGELALRPERDPAVAGQPREADAFVDEPRADAEAARGRLDVEHAQFRDGSGLLHQEDRAGNLAISLRDPAALARGVEVLDELGGDLRHERLEPLVVAVFLRIEDAV